MLIVNSSVAVFAPFIAEQATLTCSTLSSTWNLKFIRVENPTEVFMIGDGANSVKTSLPDWSVNN